MKLLWIAKTQEYGLFMAEEELQGMINCMYWILEDDE